MSRLTRRSVLAGMASSGLVGLPVPTLHAAPASISKPDAAFLDILRPPDSATVFLGLKDAVNLRRAGERWEARGIRATTFVRADSLAITLAAPGVEPTHVRLRWNLRVAEDQLILGDAWERSYGDLHWSSLVAERVMPWYFLATHSGALHGYGVKTGAKALCFWQLDCDGVTLWLDVSNGGSGVVLGNRELSAATVVSRRGSAEEPMMEAASAFCKSMCDHPRTCGPIYGSNDWYYAYGRNSAERIVRDSELIGSLAPSRGPRPFTVIDDGWKDKQKFPDMAALADAIRKHNVRPGLWIRPLQADANTPAHLLLPAARFGEHPGERPALAYDPTIPEALAAVLAKVHEAKSWGYELVKHDFTTFELFGQWGFAMGAQPAKAGWSFHDRTRTNAEIVRDLYEAIRRTAGDDTVIVGCNTIGHLGAGLFEAQRTGDDVSGKLWERTRRMGVNTLAYRLPQHRNFFLLDADCVPITTATPWILNAQWLDLLARTGTILLISPEPGAIGRDQREAIREAFATAASANETGTPVDWQNTTTPAHWEFRTAGASHSAKTYDWFAESGAWPFEI